MTRIFYAALLTTLMWATTVRAEGPEVSELTPEYLALVAQHLYRWHLDETALLAIEDVSELEFRYRQLEPELDDGDRSRFIELIIPQLNYLLILKQSDYDLPELGMVIRNEGFRIYRVETFDQTPARVSDMRTVSMNKQALIEHLFATRWQKEFPDDALMERLRTALREQYQDVLEIKVDGPQTVYVAPISKVSNELFVFWENARRLIRFSSDSDLTNPGLWDAEKLGVRMYSLEEAVVVSHAEAAGSNAYVTRDWAARALFNCIVFGQRQVITPRSE